uniref:Uncharacterized protein n=1 Tax=Raphanus sativus TaxID=3726 RepID=A0A650GC35_RAPSA|nr:hypothetical protein [Raphanus sativus]QGW48635.1 hypothetical protein [Raphanus sativus]
MLWLWGWGQPKPDRGRSRGHRSYLRRVCRLKVLGRQLKLPAQKSKESCRSKWNSSKIHLLLDFACSAPPPRETCSQNEGKGKSTVGC